MIRYWARGSLAVPQAALQAVTSWMHTSSSDIDLANRELDDFFGAQNTPSAGQQQQMLPPDVLPPFELHKSPFSTQPAQDGAPISPSSLLHSTHLDALPDQGMQPAASSHDLTDIIQALATTSETLRRPSSSSGTVQDCLESLMDDHSHTDPTCMSSGNRGMQQTECADTRRETSRGTSSSSHSSSSSSSLPSPTGGNAGSLSHVDAGGRASMVDVAQKQVTQRTAEASATVYLGETAFRLVQENKMKKGDVLTVSQLAGIMASKATPSLIPLCHPIPLTKADVQLSLHPGDHSVRVWALARAVGQTGVEMEALTAAAVAALTVYDMCKAVSKEIVISGLQLEYKSGGRSGEYRRG